MNYTDEVVSKAVFAFGVVLSVVKCTWEDGDVTYHVAFEDGETFDETFTEPPNNQALNEIASATWHDTDPECRHALIGAPPIEYADPAETAMQTLYGFE